MAGGSLCGTCGWEGHDGSADGICPECGQFGLLPTLNSAVVGFPAGTLPCPRCGHLDRAIVFRGWVRLTSFIIWARESRMAAYLCADCARRQTAANLAWTGLLGWWGFLSFLIYAPRATYYNWRAIWLPPASPEAWGAIPVHAIISGIRTASEQARVSAAGVHLLADSPLVFLTNKQQEVVLAARELYETLGVAQSASRADIRQAFVIRAKEVHPDIRPGDASATGDMIRLNQAWEVLRDDKLRAAYDWLEANRVTVFA